MKPLEAYGYVFREPNAPLERESFRIDAPGPGDVVVKVHGCGLCHTDISFIAGHVKPNQMPVILGHEISGVVVDGGDSHGALLGKNVIVPAVLPCGECEFCQGGRGNVCRRQRFPGNDFDGGFATHVVVPGRFLCPVPEETGGLSLAELSVIADAITTPYQSMVRSGVGAGDLAVVVGVGGIGTYMVQWVKHAGAHVVAIDIDERKLENAAGSGADDCINARGLSSNDVKKRVRELVKTRDLPKHSWKVFETSGTAPGQEIAFALLSFAGVLGVVGFTMDKVEIRLSNVMAFDAEIFGNWACRPEYYPDVVEAVVTGKINVRDNVEMHPLESINDVIGQALEHKLERRAVLVPEQIG